MIVVDASVVLAVLLRSPETERLAGHLPGDRGTVHAPELLDLEIAQVLRRYERAGDLRPDRALRALAWYRDLALVRHSHEPFLGRIWELRANLTAYDAAYLALAEALNAPLLTRDRKLAAAPSHRALVEYA